jgi:transposase
MNGGVIGMKYRDYNPDQLRLIPMDIGEMIPGDSAMWFVKDSVNSELVGALDTSKSEEGNAAYNPILMCRLLTWAYYNGVCSSRQIERRTYTDVEFIYLCDGQHPNFRTICKFRKNFGDHLNGLYKKIYRLALQAEVTNVGLFSIDGTVIKGNASGKKGVRTLESWKEKEAKLDVEIREYERRSAEIDAREDARFGKDGNGGLSEDMRRAEFRRKKIREAIEKLKEEEVGEKTRISLTDTDARMIKKSSSGVHVMGYNAGLAVDENRLIAHVELSNVGDDHKLVGACVAGLEETFGGAIPEGVKILADKGCTSGANAVLLEEKKLDGYLNTTNEYDVVRNKTATKQGETTTTEPEEIAIKFEYDQDHDTFTCPMGQHLKRHSSCRTTETRNGIKKVRNQVKFRSEMSCAGCELAGRCKPGKRNYKYLTREEGFEALERMREKMQGAHNREVYGKRRSTVEPTIGDLKDNLGLRSFRVRGFAAKVELCLSAFCHNLKIIWNLMKKAGKPLQPAYCGG